MLEHIAGWVQSGRYYIAVTASGLPVGVLLPLDDGLPFLATKREIQAFRRLRRDQGKGVAVKV